jgi:hypothetical protein|tara:strand:- start:311 stop:709 length:399 start_codon:yes stop_codon:yes gene_type:complete
MNNYRNNRKHRFKSTGDRNFRRRNSNGLKIQSDFSSGSEFKHRNPGRNNQNAAKLIEKYNNLAREALSSGDKILSENYLQHADHFQRILTLHDLNKSENENNNVIEQSFKKEIRNIADKNTDNNLDTVNKSD